MSIKWCHVRVKTDKPRTFLLSGGWHARALNQRINLGDTGEGSHEDDYAVVVIATAASSQYEEHFLKQ